MLATVLVQCASYSSSIWEREREPQRLVLSRVSELSVPIYGESLPEQALVDNSPELALTVSSQVSQQEMWPPEEWLLELEQQL